MKKLNNKQSILFILVLSLVIEVTLLWIVYGKTPHSPNHPLTNYLPKVSAIFNALSAISLIVAKKFAEKKEIKAHIKTIVLALTFSALFLVSYLTYHWMVGRVYFSLTGFEKFFILGLLVIHVLASIINLPMILMTLYFALTKQYETHKKIARKTYYLWQFVSWSGVIVIAYPLLFT